MERELMAEEPAQQETKPDELDQTMIEQVRLWGEVNADGILDSGCNFFAIPEIEGFIGYRMESKNAVVLGDPVCPPENKITLALAFQEYCEKQNLGVVYSIVSGEFTKEVADQLNGIALEFGEKYVLDPTINPLENSGRKAIILRNKVKNALKENLAVQEYVGHDSSVEMEIEQTAHAWLKQRKGPQIYLSEVNIFKHRFGKRWFYVRHHDTVVGLLVLNRLESSQGWLLNNVMYTKEAPHGTSELLVVSALQTLAKENCHFVLIGPIPAQELRKVTGMNKLSAAIIRWMYQAAKRIFHLSGHESFWEKFHPDTLPSYLMFPKKNLNFRSIKAILQAFNVGR